MTMRDVPLHLAADGVTIVQPHIQADSEFARQQGHVVARVEPAYAPYAQAIVDAINAAMPAAPKTGRAIVPSELGCKTCMDPESFKPSHKGSAQCESGSIASGGTRAHCTCDTCF